jgi:TMEM70/TMEM186/TMEM223 protein family
MQPKPVLLFESPPTFKVRALTWFLAGVMIFCFVGSVFVFGNMIEGDGSKNPAPLWQRIVFAAAIVCISISMFVPMWLYLKYYTVRLSCTPDTGQMTVETMRLFGVSTRTLSSSQIESATFHRGKFDNGLTVSVNAPWFRVKVKEGRGFLLDAQGRFFDADALDKLLKGNHTPVPGDGV